MAADEVASFLQEPHPGVLTTIGPGDWPHSAGMWFVQRGSDLVMWSYTKSQKTLNARRDSRASLLVEHGEPYRNLKGVLVRGHLRVVDDNEEVAAIGRLVYEKYVLPTTGVTYEDGAGVEIERQAAKRSGLILPLEKVVSWDHSRASA
jgi:nitroimidazol reductase NimA-like FMN-containing flavoprotein (pyridoxamine 5'-phosphate oxidase superfamily)